jgi:hypothetical protein
MTWRNRFLISFLTITLLPVVSGCGDDDSTGPGDPGLRPADFSGNWTLTTEVVARATCEGSIGDEGEFEAVIVQDGKDAMIAIDGGVPFPLTIAGSTATGSQVGGANLDLALTIEDGQIGGTITMVDSTVPCTEEYLIVGTRTNQAPSSEFSGNWQLYFEVRESSCEAEPVGSPDDSCLAIDVVGNTVMIMHEDGVIAGVGDGDTAILTRYDEDESLEIIVSVSGDEIFGEVTVIDHQNECTSAMFISGFRWPGECPPPPRDFSGYWDGVGEVRKNTCDGSLEYPPFCSEIYQEDVVVDVDGVPGTVYGDVLRVYLEDEWETEFWSLEVVLKISADGNSMTGTLVETYEDTAFPLENCRFEARIYMTRAANCDPDRRAASWLRTR